MRLIERHWYQPYWWLMILLAPLAWVFKVVCCVRRWAYQSGWLRRIKLSVPVVIIGNIQVGGVGKTPLVLALTQMFQIREIKVGIVSRGYGGRQRLPLLVTPDSLPEQVGDEPLLLARSGAPVVVARDRVAAAQHLLTQCPDTELILSDDGLQHCRLARDLELAVVDGARGVGNGRLLPNGPLRETLSRLARVDAIVVNGPQSALLPLPDRIPVFSMQLEPGRCYCLADPAVTRDAADFVTERVVALAGIGYPERFFQMIQRIGIQVERTLSFPDHHPFAVSDIPDDADAVLLTAKDAVKFRQLNRDKLWVLPVTATLSPDLAQWIMMRLKEIHGC